MLDLAGIVGGNIRVNAQRHKKSSQLAVTVIAAAGNLQTRFLQRDKAVGVHRNIAVLAQVFHGNADARLGKAHGNGNVDGAHGAFLLAEHQDLFQIILGRFVYLQGGIPLYL